MNHDNDEMDRFEDLASKLFAVRKDDVGKGLNVSLDDEAETDDEPSTEDGDS